MLRYVTKYYRNLTEIWRKITECYVNITKLIKFVNFFKLCKFLALHFVIFSKNKTNLQQSVKFFLVL